MKKESVLKQLEQLRIESEEREIDETTPLKILNVLLQYLNDPQIVLAVDKIQF